MLHVAARITRGARQLRLRIDATWRWAAEIATAWHRQRAAFPEQPQHPRTHDPKDHSGPRNARLTRRYGRIKPAPSPKQRQFSDFRASASPNSTGTKIRASVTTNASEWESLMGIVVYAAVTVAVFAVLGLAQKLVEKL